MVQKDISIIVNNLYENGMFRTLPFLEIFNKKLNIEVIGVFLNAKIKSQHTFLKVFLKIFQ